MKDNPRDQLHPDSEPNPDVWCDRCQRIHKMHTFTQGDYDRAIAAAGKEMARRIDERAAAEVFRIVYGS